MASFSLSTSDVTDAGYAGSAWKRTLCFIDGGSLRQLRREIA
jgi:hypothetical protein